MSHLLSGGIQDWIGGGLGQPHRVSVTVNYHCALKLRLQSTRVNILGISPVQ